MKKNSLLLLVLICAVATLQAKVKLPALVGDNMVLQQDTDVKIWGWSSAGATVEVSPSWGQTVKVKADKSGNWVALVKTPVASLDKHSITISDGEPVTVSNVLIGEVWVCSGQSNMEMMVQGGRDCPIEDAQELILESVHYPNLRLFSVKINSTWEKQDDVTGSWQQSSPAVVKKFSAIGYKFGAELQKALNIPIGIINSSCGGTWIEAWFPADLQKDLPDYEPKSIERDQLSGFVKAEILYNAMIYPLKNYAIKGFCWYQGETNIGRSKYYAERMKRMIQHWRDIWGGEKKPFYYVELPPFEYGEDNLRGALLREQQFKVMSMVENTGMVCTSDLVHEYETANIHPSRKIPIAKRLSYWALSKDYGYGDAIKTIGPVYKSMEVMEGGVVKITFDGSDCGFLVKGDIEGFEIAGANKEFRKATAVRRRPDATVIYVSHYDVGKPVAVRYRFRNCSIGNLWDAFGQPVVPFRTDNWESIENK